MVLMKEILNNFAFMVSLYPNGAGVSMHSYIRNRVMNIRSTFNVISPVFFILCIISCSHKNRIDGYVYYRLNSNPSTLDPALIVDVTGGSISAKLFNGLVRLDKDMNIIPDIAEKWSVSDNGLIYKFTLRRKVYFSNKQEVRSHDFKYSFKRVLDPKTRSPNTWVLEKMAGARDYTEGRSDDISGIRIIDDYNLEIRLERPFSPFLHLLTMTAAYVVPEEEVIKWGPDFSSHPVGTGPFTLKEWLQNRELKLESRGDYFEKKAGIKGVVYRIIAEDLTAIAEFELGNLDALAIPASELSRLRHNLKWKDLISSVSGINTYYIGMNCSRLPFSNPNIRRAINHAIDREKLLLTFYEKRGRLASGPVPDILRKWDAAAVYEYDLEKAKDIIKKAGLQGAVINFYITADQEVVDMAEFIQSYIKKTGMDVKIKQLEWSAYKEAINKGEPDMFWLSWWADYPDPENFLFPLFHSSNTGPAGNRARYMNPEVDRLIELGQRAIDERKRYAYYEKAEKLIVNEAPWVFFWHKTDYIVRQPWIKDFTVYPIYSMDKGTEITLQHN